MPEAIGWQYGVARGPAECEPEFAGLWNGLGGLWVPALGPTGSRLWDLSGYGNHGTLTNMDPGADWVPTPYGWGLDFDGGDDVVALNRPVHVGSSITAAWTLSMLWTLDALDDAGQTVYLYCTLQSGGLPGIILYVTPAGSLRYQHSGTPANHLVYSADGVLAVGGTYHITVATTGSIYASSTTLYVNGVPLTPASTTDSKTLRECSTATYIGGRYYDSARNVNGQLHSAAGWSRKLIGSEVAAYAADPFALLRPTRRVWWVGAGAGGGTEYVHAQTGVMIVTGAQAAQAAYLAAQAGALVLTGAQLAQALMQAAQVGSVVLTGTQAAQAEMVAAQVGSLILGGTQAAQADYLAAQTGDLVLGGDQATQLGYTHAQAGSLVLTGEQVTQAVYTLAQTGALELSADQLVTVASIMAQTGSLIVTGTQVVVIPGVGRGWLPLMLNAGRYQ